eukprot:TRINITY_DN6337_c0_g3_i1.p1 TRINITY_DN6337_c0_g3~~TRINITY_DN6337_c0_g3_i1.p1  ORF type:complete len:109 (-),score=24.45 TRINITY_DN6337_c0_g3_i1:12-308(-)
MAASLVAPGVWLQEHVKTILQDFGLVIIQRDGADVRKMIHENDMLFQHRLSIRVVEQWVHCDISSSHVRQSLRRSRSVRYLLPDAVLSYIHQHHLYMD